MILSIVLIILVSTIIFISIFVSNRKSNNEINSENDSMVDDRLYGMWYSSKQEVYIDGEKESFRDDYFENYIDINTINLSFCNLNISDDSNCNSYDYDTLKSSSKIVINYEDGNQILNYEFDSNSNLVIKECNNNICYVTYYEKVKG